MEKHSLYEKSLAYNSVPTMSKTKEYNRKKVKEYRKRDGICKRCCTPKLKNPTDRLCQNCIEYSKNYFQTNKKRLLEYRKQRYQLTKTNQ